MNKVREEIRRGRRMGWETAMPGAPEPPVGKRGRTMTQQENMPRMTPADYEYTTLMRLLGVSVSKHLLDEHFTLVWANEYYYEFTG